MAGAKVVIETIGGRVRRVTGAKAVVLRDEARIERQWRDGSALSLHDAGFSRSGRHPALTQINRGAD